MIKDICFVVVFHLKHINLVDLYNRISKDEILKLFNDMENELYLVCVWITVKKV